MKKLLIVLVAMILVASASFADVSFMTANSVGMGKWAVMGVYATNHNAEISGTISRNDVLGVPAVAFDTTALGVKAEYGTPIENLDVLAGYSADTYVNAHHYLSLNEKSGNTTALGVKYTLPAMGLPCDTAVMVGYEYSAATLGVPGVNLGIGQTTYAIAGIVSKQMGMFVPYGGIALKSLNSESDSELWSHEY